MRVHTSGSGGELTVRSVRGVSLQPAGDRRIASGMLTPRGSGAVLGRALAVLAILALGGAAEAGVVWDFDGTANPSGANLQLLGGTPAFVATEGGQGLAAGCSLQWNDAPALRVRPEIELRCRFRLDDLPQNAHVLATKGGEYLLRVDGHEGGHLSLFVQTEGQWEPRLSGPIVRPNAWYDVRAKWNGATLTMEVNGELFSRRHAGKIRPGSEPLTIGPIAGVIDRLEILNPGLARETALLGLDAMGTVAAVQGKFGGQDGWAGWQAMGGATCEFADGAAQLTFPQASAMFVSPTLAIDLTHMPFACLELETPGPGWTGHIDFRTDAGAGSVTFQPHGNGRPTLIAGASSDQWTGPLQRLAVSFSGGTGRVTLKKLVLADRAVGSPWLYLRDLAAGRAKLRPGREETVIAAVQNLGGETQDVRLRLHVPAGIQILGGMDQRIPYLGQNDMDLATWRVRTDRAGVFEVTVEAIAAGAATRSQSLRLAFEPLPDLPRTGYVPEPQPAQSDYIGLMHYCALWKEGTHYGWKLIEPWPGRRPAIGWYDEGTPEVADWHIKYALEHGVNAFIYCWYRAHLEPKIEHTLGHAIHDGLFQAKYRDKFQFCIMWENGCASGVKDADDLLNNVLPFWLNNYFQHPSYLKLDNMPLLFVWQPRRLLPQLGGPEGTRQTFEAMRARCRDAGFAGLRIIACMDGPDEELGRQIAASGWDAVTGYGLTPSGVRDAGIDADGIPYREHADVLARYQETWEQRDACTGNVPDIPNVFMGWDPRPWDRARPDGYVAHPKAENFAAACRDAKSLVDAKPAERWDRRLVVFDNWTEFGEGHYIEPTSGLGFSFLNTIKEVFCTGWAPEATTDIVPEDVGLQPPQRRYEQVRAGFGHRLPWQPRRISGDLLAHWQFERIADGRLVDSSPNETRLVATGMSIEPGRGGQTLRCGDGEATCPAPAPFFYTGGVTVALWCKPDQVEQSDHWMLNTTGKDTTGYRLGLGSGRPVWQIPQSEWSHGLYGPQPLPVGEWSHVAATFDNRLMRLYVNGEEVAMLERRGFINPASDVVIGGHSPGLARARFHGWLDDVRIYRRVLRAEEVAALTHAK